MIVRTSTENILMPVLDKDIIMVNNKSYLQIDKISKLGLMENTASYFDAILISETDQDLIQYAVRKIRTTLTRNIFLKPIILLNCTLANASSCERHLVDGSVVTIDNLQDYDIMVTRINQEMEQFRDGIEQLNTVSPNLVWIKTMAAYLRSRNRTRLTAIPSFESSVGYIWPELSVHFSPAKQRSALEVLAWGVLNNYLTAEFSDITYVCPSCKSNHLIYRETCAKCHSSNIENEDLIHHFPCAYVGKASDFGKGDHMKCPKCRKSLKNLGRDYDMPSSVYTCRSCNHSAQQPLIRAKCTLCKHETEVENLETVTICNYEINVDLFSNRGMEGEHQAGRNRAVSHQAINKTELELDPVMRRITGSSNDERTQFAC